MKGFKDFNKPSILSWGGHETIRDKLKPENVKESFEGWGHSGNYDSSFHDHPDIKPQALSHNHLRSIGDYTTVKSEDLHGSSYYINALLRNMGGDKTVGIKHHDSAVVLGKVKALSSAFTPENTNRKEVRVHCGIPDHIGRSLLSGGQHHIAGFLSTSSEHEIARGFANRYALQSGKLNTHVLTLNARPGSVMAIAPHSEFQKENEALVHHGARISVVKTTTQPNSYGGIQYNHEAILHADHKPLEEYGSYDHPKELK